jgi:urease accessory protein
MSSTLLEAPKAAIAASVMQRARGRAHVAFRRSEGAVRLHQFYQEGCCKIRLPRTEPGDPPEAVLLNTSGGITGGDILSFAVELGDDTQATATTQAAERIYRRSAGIARIENRLVIGAGSHLDWLPQETILFDRSALDRSLDVDLAADATAFLIESVVFGRTAMGESVHTLAFSDRWRVRQGGRLVFADGVSIDGDAAARLSRGATGGGGVAVATLVLVAPDAPARRDEIRAVLESARGEAGVSAWPGILCVRLIAASSQILRQDVVSVVETLRGRPMPRVWSC